VANNLAQVTELISRLHVRTLSGQLKWDSSAQKRKYQVRIGDFLVQMQANPFSTSNVQLTVSRLDGRVVTSVGGMNSVLGADATTVPQQYMQMIMEIFEFVSSSNEDLTDLLNMLK